MANEVIRGQIINGDTRRPLSGLRIEVWSATGTPPDVLGTAVSDASGAFTIEFPERVYRALTERQPDLYFKVFRDQTQVADTRRDVLWSVGRPVERVLVPVKPGVVPLPDRPFPVPDRPLPVPDTPTEPAPRDVFQVAGRVTTTEGRAAPDLLVEVWDRQLKGEKLLAAGSTDDKGLYAIQFDSAALKEKARPDLQVRVLDPRRDRAELARSDVQYQAGTSTTVNLTVDAAKASKPSEYDRLRADVTPVVGDTPLESLDAAGVEYVANRAGWDARLVAMAAEAATLSATTKIPASHYYALLRSGLPGDTAAVHRLTDAAVAQTLKLAANSGIITGADPIDDTVRRYGEQSLAALEHLSPDVAVSNLGQMLDVSLQAADKTTFLSTYRTTAGEPAQMWAALAQAGFDGSTIDRLRTDGKLGYLTRQNAPLVARLRSNAQIARAEDLARAGLYKADAWLPLIGTDVPKDLTAPEYAAGLAAQVNLAYPTLVAAEMVQRREIAIDDGGGGDEVAGFLRDSHGTHTLGVDPVKTWSGYGALSAKGRDGARLVERLYQLSPSNESMMALHEMQLHSAMQIARQSPQAFMQQHGSGFPTEHEAMLVYRKARQVHDTVLNVAAMYLSHRTMPNVYGITGRETREAPDFSGVPGAPTLEDLLENMDYCACDHCRSVLGPAAYFVDLLQFVDVPDVPAGKRNPIQVLFERRPDLQHLLLSCENTNVALPYIDVVNEILEHSVVNGNLTTFLGHNAREDSLSADLLADPEFVQDVAYDKTKAAVYPHHLPFDMPLEALRQFMRAWDTTLPDALRQLATPAAARREALGLNGAEYRILTDTTFRALPEYFGESAAGTIDALNTAVADGKTFCRRTDITYEQLVSLLRTSFTNPGAALVPALEALKVPLADLQSWYTGTLDDDGLRAFFPADIDSAAYGDDILQWLRDNRTLIMGLITLTDVSAEAVECNFATVELRFALPDAAANRLTALAYQKLHRFIRLWKKLGWPIETIDRAVTTFLGVAPQALTDATLDGAFAALVARLANFVWLTRRQSIPDKKLLDWLEIWDGSQTADVRREKLARLLRMGATDLADLSAMTGLDPLADDMTADMPSLIAFLEAWKTLKAARLKVADLNYLVRSRDDTGKLTPPEETLARDIKSLRDALTAVETSLSAPPASADLAFARARLALVYDNTVVDWFIGLVSGSRTYDATLETVEETLPAPLAAIDPRLTFDPFKKLLGFAGVMPPSTRTALNGAADALVLADMSVITVQADLNTFVARFKTAVQSLLDAGTADLQALDAEYPELKVVYDAVAPVVDPGAKAAAVVEAILPPLRRRLKTTTLVSTLASLLKTAPELVDVLVSGPAVLHADGDAARGVLDDFLGLEAAVAMTANQSYPLHLDPPATDDYTFYVAAPAGTSVTLAIGGTVAIPATVLGASGEVSTAAAIRLQAGALTAATVTIGSLPASRSAELRWRTKGMAKGAPPASRVYAEAAMARAHASLIRMHKAGLLLRSLPLTPRELGHLAGVNPDTSGYLNALDVEGSIGAGAQHALWTQLAWLAWFTSLKGDEPDENTWVGVLEDPARVTPQGALILAAAAGWARADLDDTLTHFGLALAALSPLAVFRRVKEAVDFITATQQPAADLIAWTTDAPNGALILAIKQRLRTRQVELAWRETLQSVNDVLRNARRDALVSYVLHHQPPSPAVDTANKLYEHFLVDVEMDACMPTSRIRLALSTVQLFVLRCLMNLEPDVSASSIRADHWAWMKRYRVWEANRKIFLYPENWLEPELRDNKSPFFRELESELLKSDITDELAEDAYLAYLKKLDEVARLDILGAYLEERTPGDQDDDVLHVFGRTNGSTHQYYYRRYEYGYWTAWDKVGLNIEGDLICPVIWKRQLFLFWVQAVRKPEGANPEETPQGMGGTKWGSSARLTVELHLSWGEYFRGKWTSPKSSEMGQPLRITGLKAWEPEKLVLGFRTEKPANVSERLIFSLLYLGTKFDAKHAIFTSKNAAPILAEAGDQGVINQQVFSYELLWAPQPASVLDHNSLREPGKLFKVSIKQPSGATASTLEENLLTKTGALFDGFRVRPLMHPVANQWEAPLFYSDEHSVFFVTPDERIETVLKHDGYYWNDRPGLVIPIEKIKIPEIYEPPIPDPIGPVIRHPLEFAVNPNYSRTISNDQRFEFRGETFGAGGIGVKGVGR